MTAGCDLRERPGRDPRWAADSDLRGSSAGPKLGGERSRGWARSLHHPFDRGGPWRLARGSARSPGQRRGVHADAFSSSGRYARRVCSRRARPLGDPLDAVPRARETTASPRNGRGSRRRATPRRHGRRRSRRRRRAGARRARSPRATSGEYQITAVCVPRSRWVELGPRLEPSRSFALGMRSSRKLRSPSFVRSKVWTYQYGSSRSSWYGSTTLVVERFSPSFRYSISTRRWEFGSRR